MSDEGLHALVAAAEFLNLLSRDQTQQRRVSERIRNLNKLQLNNIKQSNKTARSRCTQKPTKSNPKKKVDKLLGRKVRKQFFDKFRRLKWYNGQVVKVSRTEKDNFLYKFKKNVTSSVKYLVRYNDNDSEHMTKWQLQQHLV
jgi:type II secretory pathway component PulJ